MKKNIFKSALFIVFHFTVILFLNVSYSQELYESPYSIKYTYAKDSLIYDILYSGRGDFRNSSVIPYDEWNSASVLKKYGGWGPPSKQFAFPEIAATKRSDEWLRERIIAVAELFLGLEYQHHHIPVWDPPADWKWKKTCAGKNGQGADCSNFTAFVYNVALGIKLYGNTLKQSKETDLSKNNIPEFQTAEIIEHPGNYEDFKDTFRTGDLLFIKNDRGKISHVIIWLGKLGDSPDNTPLIIDSHGAEVKDSNGNEIPCGIHIRPFIKNSWYYKSFSHGLRIIKDY